MDEIVGNCIAIFQYKTKNYPKSITITGTNILLKDGAGKFMDFPYVVPNFAPVGQYKEFLTNAYDSMRRALCISDLISRNFQIEIGQYGTFRRADKNNSDVLILSDYFA